MHSLQGLLFAQHFPFTEAARKIVLEENPSLENLPEPLLERAELMARHAFSGKKYAFELHSADLLLQEILAFPIAKIIISFAGEPRLCRAFASMVADSAFFFLNSEKDKGKAAIELASELSLKFDFPDSKAFFASMPLAQYLSVPLQDDSLKLVNQFVSHGNVFLDLNGFCRFLREKSFSTVFSSLPVPLKGLPKRLEGFGKSLKAEAKAREQKIFGEAFRGSVAPEAFPPCIASMYSRLSAGNKLPHMANFTLATFLNSIGMPKARILELFKKSPNFSERIASYQLDRIAKQNYAPPSCDKIRSYGLCPSKDCPARHPLSFYRRLAKRAEGAKPFLPEQNLRDAKASLTVSEPYGFRKSPGKNALAGAKGADGKADANGAAGRASGVKE